MECAVRYILAFALVVLAGRILPGLYELVVSITTVITTFYLSSLVVILIRQWYPPKKIYTGNKAVFITGCDTGFGHETAKRLDTLGFKVFAGCLKPEEVGAKNLKKICSDNLHIVPLDVTKDESVESALQIVKENLQDKELWGVINNAGIGPTGEVEFSPISEFKEVYEVNALGPVRICKAFLPLLRRSRGRIIILASIAGRMSVPGAVTYSMSKFAAVALAEGLRTEMLKWGVKVMTVEPFIYKTNITSREFLERRLNKNWENSPEDVKKDYGTRYLDAFRKMLGKFGDAGSPNIYEVVDCMVDGITSEEPRLYYRPGLLYQKAMFYVGRLMPHCLKSQMFHYSRIKSVPDMLRQQ